MIKRDISELSFNQNEGNYEKGAVVQISAVFGNL